jgi:uncharacterized protein YggE
MFGECRRLVYLACVGLLGVALCAGLAVRPAAAQGVPGQLPGIVVTGFGAASASAESAEVQIIVGPDMYVMSPSTGAVTANDVASIIDAVVATGVDRADIELFVPAVNSVFSGPGGPGNAQLRFTIPNPTDSTMSELSDAVYKTAVTARLSIQHLGVRYTAADCASLQQAATDKAVADAQARGERLAMSLNVELGEMVQATDALYGYGAGVPDSCASPAKQTYYGPYGVGIAPPYDPTQAVEATATATITVTFEMKPGAGATPVS